MNKYARQCDAEKLFHAFADCKKECVLEKDTLVGDIGAFTFGFCFENADFERKEVYLCGIKKSADVYEITVVECDDEDETEKVYTASSVEAFAVFRDIRINKEVFAHSALDDVHFIADELETVRWFLGDCMLNDAEKELLEKQDSLTDETEAEELLDRVCRDYEKCEPIDEARLVGLTEKADAEAKKLGYGGSFPKYLKGDKYIEYRLYRESSECDGEGRYYAFGVSYGDLAEKKQFKEKMTGSEILPVHALTLNGEEISTLMKGISDILDGKIPDGSFDMLPNVRSFTQKHFEPTLLWFLFLIGTVLSVSGALWYFLGFGENLEKHLPVCFIPLVAGIALICTAVVLIVRSKQRVYLTDM